MRPPPCDGTPGARSHEPLLTAVGKDKAAQISIQDKSEINLNELRSWLKRARTVIFDYVGMYARKRATRKQ